MLNNWQNSCTNLVGKDFWQLDIAVNNKLNDFWFEQDLIASNEVRNKEIPLYKHISGLLNAKQYPFGGRSNRQTKGALQMFSYPPKP